MRASQDGWSGANRLGDVSSERDEPRHRPAIGDGAPSTRSRPDNRNRYSLEIFCIGPWPIFELLGAIRKDFFLR